MSSTHASAASGTRAASSARRQAILEHAAAVFAARGFASATVRDVGDAAGILSGSLYHHFESKDQMLEEILSEVFDDLLARYREAVATIEDAEERLQALFVTALDHVQQWPDATRIVENDYAYLSSIPRFSFLVKRNTEVRNLWVRTISDGIAQGRFRKDTNVDVAYITMMGAIASATRWRQLRSKKQAIGLAHEMMRVFVDGIAAP